MVKDEGRGTMDEDGRTQCAVENSTRCAALLAHETVEWRALAKLLSEIDFSKQSSSYTEALQSGLDFLPVLPVTNRKQKHTLKQIRELLQFGLANGYMEQGDFPSAAHVFPRFVNERSKTGAFPNHSHAEFLQNFAKECELLKVEIYARAFLSGESERVPWIVVKKNYHQEAFEIMMKKKKQPADAFDYYSPLITDVTTKHGLTLVPLFPVMIKGLIDVCQYESAIQLALGWKKLSKQTYAEFLLRDIPFEQAVRLELSNPKQQDQVSKKFKRGCNNKYRNLIPGAGSNECFEIINEFILCEDLSRKLIMLLPPPTCPSVPPKKIATIFYHLDELALYEKGPADFVRGQCETHFDFSLSEMDVLSLLLNAAILQDRVRLVKDLLASLGSYRPLGLTALTILDAMSYSPVTRCMQSGHPEIVACITEYISAQRDKTKTTHILEDDLATTMALLEFRMIETLSASEIFKLLLEPLYGNLDYVISYLTLLGVSV